MVHRFRWLVDAFGSGSAKREPLAAPAVGPAVRPALPYAELHCLTNFTFLEGASHADELVARAVELGYQAIAVTDRNSLAGIVRAHTAAKESDLQLIDASDPSAPVRVLEEMLTSRSLASPGSSK